MDRLCRCINTAGGFVGVNVLNTAEVDFTWKLASGEGEFYIE